MNKNKRLEAILKTRDKWLSDIKKDHGAIEDDCIGIEIVGRILVKNSSDHQYIDEILENIREIGAAEITKQVKL